MTRIKEKIADYREHEPVLVTQCALLLFAFALICFCYPTNVTAQDDGLDNAAPPPIQIVSKDDLDKLNAQTDIKQKVQLGLSIMNTRLIEAEQQSSRTDYERMFLALGQFHGLMNLCLDFLVKSDNTKGKSLDNFRKFELALKGYQTRIEVIHRELPMRWEEYPRKLIKYVRDGRAKALQPLFTDSIVPTKTLL